MNDAVPSTAYSPVTITNPLTNEPLTVYNQDPATRGQVRNVLTTLPDLTQRYNGVEFQVNTRLTQGDGLRRLHHRQRLRRPGQPATSTTRTSASTTAATSASTRRTRSAAASATCCRPDVSCRARSARPTGLPQTRTYVVTTTIVPGLTQVTQNVQVAERGEYPLSRG